MSNLGVAVGSGLSGAWYEVPLKTKLQGLFALLMSETDEAARTALLTKLQVLLSLPDAALQQVLQHPDLLDFNRMLDAALLGQADLGWIENQLGEVDVVPVTTTIHRIDVRGKPAFLLDSTATAQANSGGPSEPVLKALPATPSESPPAPMMVSQAAVAPGVTTLAAPVTAEAQLSQLSVGVSEVGPAPAPAAVAAPSPVSAPTLAPTPTLAVAPAPVAVASAVPTVSSSEAPSEPSGARLSTQSGVIESTSGVETEAKRPESTVSNSPASESLSHSTTPSAGKDDSGASGSSGSTGSVGSSGSSGSSNSESKNDGSSSSGGSSNDGGSSGGSASP
ncbi:MAG: hypothetical protein WBB07_08315 [Mycobacterium sp.]